MSKIRFVAALSAAFSASSLILAQDVAKVDRTAPALSVPGTVTIEHGDDRIVVQIGSDPKVTINGADVAAEAVSKPGALACVADGYRVQWMPTAQWTAPMLYSVDGYSRYLDLALVPNVLQAKGNQLAGGKRSYIGVQVGSVPAALADHLELDSDTCVLILDAKKDGPAGKAGLRKNDILVGIDSKEVVTSASLRAAVAAREAGDPMLLHILRRGKRLAIGVTVGERAANQALAWSGLDPQMLNGYWAQNLSVPQVADLMTSQHNGYYYNVPESAKVSNKLDQGSLQQQLQKIERQVEKLQQQLEKLTR